MSAPPLLLEFATPEDTCRFAQLLAPKLAPGDTVLLGGGVGAGKTHFARCLIQSQLDVPEDVPSPTYTLVQTYETLAGQIWHADLYRLTDTAEVDELGLSQAFSEAICLIEWPDRLADQVPSSALTLTLDAAFGDDRRKAECTWSDPKWSKILREVLDE